MTGRGGYAKGAARRAEILATALVIIGRDGYRNTTLRAIGKALGMEPAHILYYFKSREELLEEVIRSWDEQHKTRAAEAGYTGFDLDWWVRSVPRNMEIPGLIRLYTVFTAEAAEPEHPSHVFMQQRLDDLKSALVETLVGMRESGRLAGDRDPVSLANALIALTDGLQLQWLLDRSLDLPAELERGVTALLGAE